MEWDEGKRRERRREGKREGEVPKKWKGKVVKGVRNCGFVYDV